jgi:hypothetical protein
MAGWVAAATIGGALIGSAASSKASKAQTQAQREGDAAQERMFNRQVELQEPFRQAGVNALPELIQASRYTPFGMEQFQQDPGYGFRLKEGLRALESSAAARGGLLSGNQMRGVTRFGQGLASDEYTNAFNRYQAERAARLNPLQSLAGMGQTTATTLANQAGQYGQNLAQGAATMGNIRASGYTNQANALTGALGQGLNYYQNQQMMNRFFPQQQSSGAAPLGMPGNPFPYDVTP